MRLFGGLIALAVVVTALPAPAAKAQSWLDPALLEAARKEGTLSSIPR